MDFGWLSGCVGVTHTAIALMPTKRFLTSLACGVCLAVRCVDIRACVCAVRGKGIVIVSRLWIGSASE